MKKKIVAICLCFLMVVGSTVQACALTQTHHYSKRHLVPLLDGGAANVEVRLYIELTHDSGIRTRTFTEEEYGMVAESPSAASLKNRLSPSMGVLTIYTPSTAAKCYKTSTPSILVDPTWLYHDEAISNRRVGVVVGSTAYAELGYAIFANDSPWTVSGTTKFEGIAKGTQNITAATTINESDEDSYAFIEKYVKIRNDAALLSKSLKKETPYTQLYLYEKGYKAAGAAVEDAEKKAETALVKNHALEWYAEAKQLVAGTEQVEAYLKDLMETYTTAVNADMYKKACDTLGITFEQWIRNDVDTYRTTCTIENIYQDYLASYKEEHKASGDLWTGADEKAFEKAWEGFVTEIVDAYKNTVQFQTLQEKINVSLNLLQQEETASVDELKQQAIF